MIPLYVQGFFRLSGMKKILPLLHKRNAKSAQRRRIGRQAALGHLVELQAFANNRAVSNTNRVTQLEIKNWTIKVAIVGGTEPKKEDVELDYDSEKGVSIADIKQQLRKKFGDEYSITLVYNGSNTQRNSDLKNPEWVLKPDLIKAGKGMYLAVLKPESDAETAAAKDTEQVSRPNNVIAMAKLAILIKNYGFKKVVTANHINNASSAKATDNSGVAEQQIAQVSGPTLFIDPFYKAPGKEGQYHDMLVEQGGSSKQQDGIWIVTSKDESVTVGVLPMRVYTDELANLASSTGVSVSNYISDKRPPNVIEE